MKKNKLTKEQQERLMAHMKEIEDEKYPEIIEFLKTWKDEYCSVSLLQRYFRLGYNSASRIIERLRQDGNLEIVDRGTFTQNRIVR